MRTRKFNVSFSNREKIISAFNLSTFSPARKQLRVSNYSDVEEALFTRFKSAQDSNIPLTGPLLLCKANELARKLAHNDFQASNAWIERFKRLLTMYAELLVVRVRQLTLPLLTTL